jgi:hypothetical protein
MDQIKLETMRWEALTSLVRRPMDVHGYWRLKEAQKKLTEVSELAPDETLTSLLSWVNFSLDFFKGTFENELGD